MSAVVMSAWIGECPDIDRWQAFIRAHSVQRESGCIEWTRRLTQTGYGRVRWMEDGRMRQTSASRMAYLAFVGPLAPGMVPDHLCHNRACVNVQHLEAVTAEENCSPSRRWVDGKPQPPAKSRVRAARPRLAAAVPAASIVPPREPEVPPRVISLNPRLAHLAHLVA